MQPFLVLSSLLLAAMVTPPFCYCRKHSVLHDGNEVIDLRSDSSLDHEVIWAVQISDLHISSYHTDRSLSLQKLMGPLLKLISPSLVLITGDLTGFIIPSFM